MELPHVNSNIFDVVSTSKIADWSLPPTWSAIKDIPDSVEILEVLRSQMTHFRCVLFGRESTLKTAICPIQGVCSLHQRAV
jgi:hypothetical protein